MLDKLLLDNFITTSTVMARRESLIEAGMFPPERRISHDFELWLRMASKWRLGYIDRPLLRYRYSPGSLSNNKLATALDALKADGTSSLALRKRPKVGAHQDQIGRVEVGQIIA